MRHGLLLALALSTFAMADPLDEAQARFEALQGYQLALRSTAADGRVQQMRYFYRRPGWVRMEMIEPYRGLVLVYDPVAHRISLWPFGPERWPKLSLAPDSPLLREHHGHRVDRSDVGTLLARLRALRARGRLTPLGESPLDGQAATGCEIAGEAGAGREQRYRIWFARETMFPIRVQKFGPDGATIEMVEMSEVLTDPAPPEALFRP